MTSSNLSMAGETAGETTVRTLVAERATPENIVLFGAFIGGPPDGTARLSNFYDQAVMVQPSPFHSDLPVEISVCTIEPRPFRVRWMERHFQHTQAFLPLGGKPFVMVMAPATEDGLPDPDQVRAILLDGSAGFLLHVGVWHEFAFSVEPATQIAVLLTKEATQGLSKDNMVGTEGYSADLEKKDIAARLGIEWDVVLG